jgi:acyl carrier protein
MTEVETRLREVVAGHLDLDPARLRPEARLGEDLCLDSLAAIELAMVIEDEFDIVLPDEVTAGMRTFDDVVVQVRGRVEERSPSM